MIPCFERIRRVAEMHPDRIALVCTDERHHNHNQTKTITYRALQLRIDTLAYHLSHTHGLGRTKRTRLLILYRPPSKFDLVATMLALQTLQCVAIFCHPKAFAQGLRHWANTLLTETEPDAVIGDRSILYAFGALSLGHSKKQNRTNKLHWIYANSVFGAADPVALSTINIPNHSQVTPDTQIAHLFSSGSTGQPKPIVVTHAMQQFQLQRYGEMLQQKGLLVSSLPVSTTASSSNSTPYTSLHFSMNFVPLDLSFGGTCVLHPYPLSQPAHSVQAVGWTSLLLEQEVVVCSAPPSVWHKLHEYKNKKNTSNNKHSPLPPTLRLVLAGGAETSVQYLRNTAELLHNNNKNDNVFYRVYGATEALPICVVQSKDVLRVEAQQQVCRMGGGVCLGKVQEGLEMVLDDEAWKTVGGSTELLLPHCNSSVTVGELRVTGHAVSPSCRHHSSDHNNHTRVFGTGDVCYVDPVSEYVFFLGRKSQAVVFPCGSVVPPACVEMILYERQLVARCALVGGQRPKHIPPSSERKLTPVLVVQLNDDCTVPAAVSNIQAAFQESIWSHVLQQQGGLNLAVYPKPFPVDERHSSKTNRRVLRQWALELSPRKLVKVF